MTEELLSRSLFVTNGIPNDAGHLDRLANPNENPVPVNLFQDSCNLKLSTLPSHDREKLEDLINKIKYQINYFSLDNKTQSNKVKLTCKLCCVTLRIAKVEKHVLDQEHLRNLTKRCKNGKKTSATAAISKKIWDFLDFEESSQCYRCTVCNLNLSESRDSWNKHFQSATHRKKLKALKPKNPSNSISTFSSASGSNCSINSLTDSHKKVKSIKPSNGPISSAGTESNKNLFDAVTQFLSDKDKKALKAVKCELRENINYFEPSYENESGKLYLFCKLCRVAVLLKNVSSHVLTDEHWKNMKKDSSIVTSGAARKHVDSVESYVPQSSAPKEVNQKSDAVTESLTNDLSRKVVKELTHKLKDYMYYFEPSYENGSKKPQFTCKICNIALPSKNARLHIFSFTHLDNLRKNMCVMNRGSSHDWPVQILNDVISQFHNKLYFFQLIYDMESNGVYFVCKVCTVVLIPEDVKNHINSLEHSENVQKDPIVLQYDSLNHLNKQIINKTATATKDRIRDFVFVYRIGTDELRFYCKYCHLTLIPQNVENHAKSSHHLEALSAQSSQNHYTVNSHGQSFKNDAQSSAAVSSKTVFNSTHPPKTQNSTVFDPFADIEKKFMENFKNDCNYKYFELLHSADSNKFYFKCRLCDVTVKPTHVANHVQVGYHLKNMTLSSYFENFHSLKEPSKIVVRRLFYEIGDKLNGFLLLPDVGDKNLQLQCKLCNSTMSPDFVVNHLQSKEHQERPKKEKSAKCASSRASLRSFDSSSSLDSEPTTRRTVKSVTPVCTSAEVHLSPALSNLRKSTPNSSLESVRDPIEGVVRKYSNKTLKVGLNFQTSVYGTCFICQDCNTVIPCTAVQNNGLFKEVREKLFMNCCGKSAEAALLNSKRSKALKNNILDSKTVPPSIIESKESNSTVIPENSTESEVNFLNSSNKEILKTLIDKIGMKINHFDFVLKHSSDELRFRCKFCCVVLRPETVGDHINYQEHVKHSQLSNLPNLRFESLNDSDKKLVRKLFNKIGNEINDFDVKLCFECKICGVNVSTETVASHVKSEEHLKHLTGHGSRDGAATDVCDAKSSQDFNDFVNFNINRAQETFSLSDAHRSPPEPCQKADDFNRKFAKSQDEVQKRTSGDKVSQISDDINLNNTAAGKKLLMDSEVSQSVSPPMSVESTYRHRKAQENPIKHAVKCATTVNTAKTSYALGSRSSNNDSISPRRDQSHVQVPFLHEPSCPPTSPSVQKSGFLKGENRHSHQMTSQTEIKSESEESTAQLEDSRLVPGLITSESSQIFLCFICRLTVSSKDIRNHVNSGEHTISSTVPYSINFQAFQDYYRDLIKMFTGNVSNQVNKFEILYELPGSTLRFYCKFCRLMLRAEFFEHHVNEHLKKLPLKSKVCYSLAAESGSQPFKKFLCEPCNIFVYFKDVDNHVSSVAHSVSLLSVRNFLKFKSFLPYKDRVLETLVHSKSKKTSDFEFFSESHLPKLHVFCKPCELLLQPEYLDPHVGLPQHGLNSMIMEQWDNSYGPYHRSFYASKEEISNNLPSSSVNTSTDWCSIM